MKVCVVGTGYVGLVAGTCFAESGNDVICVDNDAAKIGALAGRQVSDLRAGLEELIRRNVDGRAARRSAPTLPRRSQKRSSASSPSARRERATAPPISPPCSAWRARSGGRWTATAIVVTKSTVPVGTADRVRAGRRRRHGAPVRRGLEPRVPEGRRGDRRLHEARPRRDRHRAPNAIEIMRELYEPFVRTGNPILVMDNRERRDDEVRRQCASRDAHLVHERDREPVRARRRRRRSGAPRHRLRPPHRPALPLPRRRLRRLVLPEGRAGDDPHGATSTASSSRCCSAVEDVNDAQKRRLVDKVMAELRREPTGQDVRDLGALVQATHRRHARGAVAHDRRGPSRRAARRCASTIPRRWARRGRSSASA